MTKQTNHQDEEVLLYEVGYLVVPTVAAEQLPGVVQEIKSILEKHKAVIEQEGAPEMRELAYQIPKVSVGKRQNFSNAYFGWITFKTAPDQMVAIKKQIDALTTLLRSMLIKTDEEIVIAPAIPTEETTPEAKTSPEELDKKIENLVVA